MTPYIYAPFLGKLVIIRTLPCTYIGKLTSITPHWLRLDTVKWAHNTAIPTWCEVPCLDVAVASLYSLEEAPTPTLLPSTHTVEFDGGYNYIGYTTIQANTTCDVCGTINTTTLSSGAGEYHQHALCLPCIQHLFTKVAP